MTINHLSAEQLGEIEEVRMISKAQFDDFYNSYKKISLSRTFKEYAVSYSPSRLSSYFFPDSPTDFLIKNVEDLSIKNGTLDKKTAIGIAQLLRSYLTNRNNYDHKFCKYLIDNLGSVVGASQVLESSSAFSASNQNTTPQMGGN